MSYHIRGVRDARALTTWHYSFWRAIVHPAVDNPAAAVLLFSRIKAAAMP
jgi:hypothetical protein